MFEDWSKENKYVVNRGSIMVLSYSKTNPCPTLGPGKNVLQVKDLSVESVIRIVLLVKIRPVWDARLTALA